MIGDTSFGIKIEIWIFLHQFHFFFLLLSFGSLCFLFDFFFFFGISSAPSLSCSLSSAYLCLAFHSGSLNHWFVFFVSFQLVPFARSGLLHQVYFNLCKKMNFGFFLRRSTGFPNFLFAEFLATFSFVCMSWLSYRKWCDNIKIDRLCA